MEQTEVNSIAIHTFVKRVTAPTFDGKSMHLRKHGFLAVDEFVFGSPMPIRFPRTRAQW